MLTPRPPTGGGACQCLPAAEHCVLGTEYTVPSTRYRFHLPKALCVNPPATEGFSADLTWQLPTVGQHVKMAGRADADCAGDGPIAVVLT